jgi:outer membrane protein assembly factor BamB
MKELFFCIAILLTFSLNAQQANWRGENRDGHYPGKGLLQQWPDDGPERILTVEGIGRGYSSVVVANGLIYATGMIDNTDHLTAIDPSGTIKWQVPYGQSWQASHPDTRSTPIIEDDRVYLVSGVGELVCLNAKTGEQRWMVNVDKDYEAQWHRWGVAESPLIVDDMVICSPGGAQTTIVAFDKMTGKEIWKSEPVNAERSYVSPVLYNYKGVRSILAMTARHLLAINPDNGQTQWVYNYYKPEWEERRNSLIIANTPLVKDDEIYISMGYNYPSVMLKVDPSGRSVSEKWVDRTLDNHHHGMVLVDGYIYGSNWINNGQGNWVCLDWETGQVQYEDKWENKGSIIYVDGMLYCYEEKMGNLALVRPNPQKFEVVSSFRIDLGAGPHWAHPTIFDGKLYVRHGDVLMVFNLMDNG